MTQREFIEKIYKDLEDVIEKSNNVNDENEERILKELALLMLYFNVSNNKLQLSNIQIMKIKNKIFKLIDDIFDDEIEDIIEKMSNSLISTTHKVERYYGGKVNADFVNSKFKNKTFKERHSQNSTEIKNKLKSTVFKFIKGGIAIALIKSSIDKIYKIHKYNIIRLLKTEINRVQNRLFLELNKNKKFRYCSVFERNTCADCKSLDGHIFNYDEALDLIPQHPNCLCYWEVLDDKNDIAEYEKYKEVLGEKAPEDLHSYREIKYNESNRWEELKQEYTLLKNSSYLQQRLDYIWKEDSEFIPTNTIIEHVKIIAGNGSDVELRSRDDLSAKFGGEPEKWSKKVGKIESEKYTFDVHWNEYNGIQYWMKLKYRKERK